MWNQNSDTKELIYRTEIESFAHGYLVFPTPCMEKTVFSPLYILGSFVIN